MIGSPIERLRNKVEGDGNDITPSILTSMVNVGKELGCIGEIIGREFKIFDPDGKLVFTVEQMPMRLNQFNTLRQELTNIGEIQENSTKKKLPKKGRRGRR